MKLHTKILLGLLLGASFGLVANFSVGPNAGAVVFINEYVAGPVGQIFLRLLFMIVMPLVFASIALGVAHLGDVRHVGRVGAKSLAYFITTTALAAMMGLLLVQLFEPGSRVPDDVRTELLAMYADDAGVTVRSAATKSFGIDTFVSIVTRNPLKSAVEGDMLGVIFFALMLGSALTMIPRDRAEPLIDVLESLNDAVIKIVEIAMKLAPYGVAGLIFGVTSRFGIVLLKPLAVYIMVVLGGLTLHSVVTLGLIIRFVLGVPVTRYFALLQPSLATAFSTSSSGATLATNLHIAQTTLRIPGKLAGFVLPIGSTMCMNGTALFEGITVIFLCEVFGTHLSLMQMIVVLVMSVLTAIGAAAVPGGSIPLLVGILASFGVPGEGIAVVLGVDRILDMARTTVNVLGDMTAVTFVAKSEGVWDASMLDTDPVPASPTHPGGSS